jgi:tetratricopeptide (TPR) repeat protein
MSRKDETGSTNSTTVPPVDSVTEGWVALRLFTNRHSEVRRFACYLNDDPPKKEILFLYGDGGNGKSLLLKRLKEHYCWRLQPVNWEYLKTLSEYDITINLTDPEGADPVPRASLDFADKDTGDHRPKDPFYGLLSLRRQLAGHGLQFGLYEFASVQYLRLTHQLSKESVNDLFPKESVSLVLALASVIPKLAAEAAYLSLGKAVAEAFDRHAKQYWRIHQPRHVAEAQGGHGQVERIASCRSSDEILRLLPRLFADDLNLSMARRNAPKRIVLLFDTHEALWGHQRALPDQQAFERDEWLRSLLLSLERERGIVTVVAGRDRPEIHGWMNAPTEAIHPRLLDLLHVGYLRDEDASEYLRRAGVRDINGLHESLIGEARVGENEVHPLYLGLCTDIALAAEAKGSALTAKSFQGAPELRNRAERLINRLLYYVDPDVKRAVQALSACRVFDFEIYKALGQSLDYHVTRASFETLTGFSFVGHAKSGDKAWHRIHDKLRELYWEHREAVAQEAQNAMEQYYRSRHRQGDRMALVEALYHANRVDWERGAAEWAERFDESHRLGDYEFCRALLNLRGELVIASPFYMGQIALAAAEYFSTLGRYPEAERELQNAITGYDEALTQVPGDQAAQNNRANALQRLGDLQAELGRPDQARQSYSEAISSYRAVQKIAAGRPLVYHNMAAAYGSLGEVQAKLGQIEQARQSCLLAVAVCDADLEIVRSRGAVGVRPERVALAHVARGNVLKQLGRLEAELGAGQQASQRYTEAIGAYGEALKSAPDHPEAHINDPSAAPATVSSNSWLATVLEAYANKAGVLGYRGDLEVDSGRPSSARRSYAEAITACDEALGIAPRHVQTYINKGIVLNKWGTFEFASGRNDEARQRWTEANAALEGALLEASGEVDAQYWKGLTFGLLGDLEAKLGRKVEACQNLSDASSTFSRVMEIAPGDDRVPPLLDYIRRRIAELECAQD